MNPKAANLYNKALELIKLDKLPQAKRNLEKSLKLQPNFFQAHNSLGNVFEKEGFYVKALEHYLKADQLLPNNPTILTNIGNAHSRSGNNVESSKFYAAAISADPNYLNATINLLISTINSNSISQAHQLVLSKTSDNIIFLILVSIFLQLVKNKNLAEYKELKVKALELSEKIITNESNKRQLLTVIAQAGLGFCIFHNILSFLTHQYEEHYLAFADFLLDVISNVSSCKAISEYFYALQHLRSGKLEAGLLHIEKSIANGCSDSLKTPLIDILFGLNRPEEAFNHLIALNRKRLPSPVTASLFFRHGDFKNGWNDYNLTEHNFNHLTQLNLTANDLSRKTVLLLTGQGLGDIIMFLSCLNDFKQQCSPETITINCEPRLHSLIQRSFPGISAIWKEELFDPRFIDKNHAIISKHDVCLKLSTICSLTRSTLNDFYPQQRFILPDDKLKILYTEKLTQLPEKISIGFSWKGGALKNTINNKNIALTDYISLFRIPGINWINLQYGDVADEISSFNETHGTNLIHFDEIDPLKEIETQCALISNLDLVIQTSNTSIHLAGSQGIPTWVMITEPSDFRWFDGKDNDMSPWYENMRVCRKAPELQWSDYIANLAKELQVKLDSFK